MMMMEMLLLLVVVVVVVVVVVDDDGHGEEEEENFVINDDIFAQGRHMKVISRTESRTAQEYTREFGGHEHTAFLSIVLSSSAVPPHAPLPV